jgi:sarcosine oxidase subunit alpha
MAPSRIRPPGNPVTLTIDGEEIVAERGEPLAAAILAAGKTPVARSPKFHRPRGPACLRGGCDGCLARVNEAPNVMTCLVPAEEGLSVVTQNRLGPRSADLLQMSDWFFPEGLNHHELFAGVPGVQAIMQGLARRVAGLGRLPLEPVPARKATRRTVDVVVVGAGPSGMAVTSRLASADLRVEVIDDMLEPGGGATALAPDDAATFASIRAPFDAAVASGAIRLRSRTTAGAVYGEDLLVVGGEGAEILSAGALVLACGGHDGVLAFEGNDVPGVMSARAAGWLLARGVLVGARIAVVVTAGGGPFGESFARAASAHAEVQVVHGDPLGVRGASRVKAVRVRTAKGELELACDAVLVDAPRSPAFELCEQAGAAIVHEPRGFVVRTGFEGQEGRIGQRIWATGEVVGLPLDAASLDAHGALVAKQIAARAG